MDFTEMYYRLFKKDQLDNFPLYMTLLYKTTQMLKNEKKFSLDSSNIALLYEILQWKDMENFN